MTHARIGEIVVSHNPDDELVALGLGSCIGVVMIDTQAQVAGLAHVMLPESGGDRTQKGKFADTAIPELLARMVSLGAVRGRLQVAITGGAAMFGTGGQLEIGARNAAAVREALSAVGLGCHAADTGGTQGRTVRVNVGAGSASVRIAGGTAADLLPDQRRRAEGRLMEVLEQDRIAALVEAAKEGQLPEAETPAPRRGGRVRTIDFSRPTKFGADHQRGLNRAIDTFCQTANTRLSSELRWPLELEPLGTAQLTWTATQGQVPPHSLLAVLEIEPLGTRIVLTVEQSFLIVCLECMLGGAPERPNRNRRLTEIDWSLAHSLFDSIVAPLSLAWHEFGGVTLRLIELDAHDASQIASVSEPTFSSQIEVKINQQSYSLGLLVPWAAIEPIERKISGREADEQEVGHATPLQDPLGHVPVAVRAEVAHVRMAVRDILALGPGSTIHFEAPAEDGVELYADSVPLARARAGRQGQRRAVQLSGFFEENERSWTNHAADPQTGPDAGRRRSA